jgi:glycosyltransferase involved in cell wall biosynthesis
MKVLLLTQVLPYPPDSGPKVKTWNVLKYLAQRHEVTLISFVRGDQSEAVEHLKKFCKAVYTTPMERGMARELWPLARSFATNQPFLMTRDDRKAMRDLVDHVARETQFDIAHADQLNMCQYAQRARGARKILDAHNALWLLYQRLARTMSFGPRKLLLERDWRLLKQYEGRLCREFNGVLAVSLEDKVALESAMGHDSDIVVIPIAVDTDEVTFVPRQPNAEHILHIGTMYWPPNIDGIQWFIREVFPLIRAQRPNTIFDIVGAQPPPSLLDMATADSGLNVTGYVKDPNVYIAQAGVMVVPLRAGGGMRVKILNALAQGLPIVSTTLGAEGITVEHERHLLIANAPADFAAATLRLLNEPAFAAVLGRNGRKLIQEKYDYRVVCQPLDELYTKQALLTRV